MSAFSLDVLLVLLVEVFSFAAAGIVVTLLVLRAAGVLGCRRAYRQAVDDARVDRPPVHPAVHGAPQSAQESERGPALV